MSTQTVELSVTRDHINNGTPNRPDCCPIALALKEKFPNAKEIAVGEGDIEIVLSPILMLSSATPENCQAFIENFDSMDVVEDDDSVHTVFDRSCIEPLSTILMFVEIPLEED